MTILNTIYPGTPPAPGSDAYKAQVDQINTMAGEASDTYAEAEQVVVTFFVPDMSYHRGAISQALGNLKRLFD